MTLGVLSAIQSAVIIYGLEKFYQTWSRLWVVIKAVFNSLKAKIGTKKVEEKKKPNEIQLKVRKSNLKRLGQIL